MILIILFIMTIATLGVINREYVRSYVNAVMGFQPVEQEEEPVEQEEEPVEQEEDPVEQEEDPVEQEEEPVEQPSLLNLITDYVTGSNSNADTEGSSSTVATGNIPLGSFCTIDDNCNQVSGHICSTIKNPKNCVTVSDDVTDIRNAMIETQNSIKTGVLNDYNKCVTVTTPNSNVKTYNQSNIIKEGAYSTYSSLVTEQVKKLVDLQNKLFKRTNSTVYPEFTVTERVCSNSVCTTNSDCDVSNHICGMYNRCVTATENSNTILNEYDTLLPEVISSITTEMSNCIGKKSRTVRTNFKYEINDINTRYSSLSGILKSKIHRIIELQNAILRYGLRAESLLMIPEQIEYSCVPYNGNCVIDTDCDTLIHVCNKSNKCETTLNHIIYLRNTVINAIAEQSKTRVCRGMSVLRTIEYLRMSDLIMNEYAYLTDDIKAIISRVIDIENIWLQSNNRNISQLKFVLTDTVCKPYKSVNETCVTSSDCDPVLHICGYKGKCVSVTTDNSDIITELSNLRTNVSSRIKNESSAQSCNGRKTETITVYPRTNSYTVKSYFSASLKEQIQKLITIEQLALSKRLVLESKLSYTITETVCTLYRTVNETCSSNTDCDPNSHICGYNGKCVSVNTDNNDILTEWTQLRNTIVNGIRTESSAQSCNGVESSIVYPRTNSYTVKSYFSASLKEQIQKLITIEQLVLSKGIKSESQLPFTITETVCTPYKTVNETCTSNTDCDPNLHICGYNGRCVLVDTDNRNILNLFTQLREDIINGIRTESSAQSCNGVESSTLYSRTNSYTIKEYFSVSLKEQIQTLITIEQLVVSKGLIGESQLPFTITETVCVSTCTNDTQCVSPNVCSTNSNLCVSKSVEGNYLRSTAYALLQSIANTIKTKSKEVICSSGYKQELKTRVVYMLTNEDILAYNKYTPTDSKLKYDINTLLDIQNRINVLRELQQSTLVTIEEYICTISSLTLGDYCTPTGLPCVSPYVCGVQYSKCLSRTDDITYVKSRLRELLLSVNDKVELESSAICTSGKTGTERSVTTVNSTDGYQKYGVTALELTEIKNLTDILSKYGETIRPVIITEYTCIAPPSSTTPPPVTITPPSKPIFGIRPPPVTITPETPPSESPILGKKTPPITSSVKTLLSKSPIALSVASPVKKTLPVASPVKTLPVRTPVKTLPVKTLPVASPVKTLPVRTPVKTLPVASPVKLLPVRTLPVRTPLGIKLPVTDETGGVPIKIIDMLPKSRLIKRVGKKKVIKKAK